MPKQYKIDKFLPRTAFAELNGVRPSFVRFYSDINLIPYTQVGKGKGRMYNVRTASKRLNEILKLKKKGKSVLEMEKILKDKK